MRAFNRITSGMWGAALVIGVLANGNCAGADFRFGTPVNLGSPPNSAYADVMPSMSSDGLEVYFWSNRPGGFGNWDLWVSTRASTEDDWLPASNVGSQVNSAEIEAMPCLSADGLELYFSRGSESTGELMVARRSTKAEPWGMAGNLGSVVNSPSRDDMPRLTSDGLELYFISARAGGRGLSDIWVTKRPTVTDDWDPPVNLSAVNSSGHDQWVNLSDDGLALLFQSDRSSGEYGGLFMSRRTSKDDPWTTPVYLGLPMTASVYTLLSSISSDGTTLYLSDHINYAPRSGGAGSADMWQVPVIPFMDFSGDGSVDLRDLLAMIDCWGTDEPLCDIGPMPWGDGVVDKKDLEVLMSHWGQEVQDTALVAHWRLDETEGIDVLDSAGDNHAFVIGTPVWKPDAGKVGGALEFDGTTLVATDSVLNPNEGPFSVLAWVKGGAPGQVIISQTEGANWLRADPLSGSLMTELRAVARVPMNLSSATLITDGDWHRIGLVWDGTNRMLYVDGLIAAADTQPSLSDSDRVFYIGCDKAMTPSAFWTGLIDDVRIYHRAVKP